MFMLSFWIVLTGALVAASLGLIGCFLILRKMAMLGDAISHGILPGLVIAFLLTSSLGVLPMFLGAVVAGVLTAVIVQWLQRQRVQEDAAMGVTFTGLFALGVVLLSLYAGKVHLDTEHVLYGELAYVPWDVLEIGGLEFGPRAVWMVGINFAIMLIALAVWYKEWKICSFDPGLAASLGIPVALFQFLFMVLVSMTLVAAFESVGAILSVAMLVVPGATAYLLTDRLESMLLLSVIIGVLCSISGYGLATLLDASISGSMTVTAGALFAVAFVFSPKYGLLKKKALTGTSRDATSRA